MSSATVETAQQVQIKMMVAADAAQAVNGKLYILGGGFDRINMPTQPFQFRFELALLIDVPWTATNEPYQLIVELLDADGQPVGYRAEVEMETGRPPGSRRGTSFTVPLTLPVFAEFPGPGRYTLRGSINGIEQEQRVSIEAIGFTPTELPPPQ
jgi:hypothetical protein